MSVSEDIKLKMNLIDRGFKVIVRRIDPKTREEIAQVYAKDIYAGRAEADSGSTECCYLLLDLFTGQRIERRWGQYTKEAHD